MCFMTLDFLLVNQTMMQPKTAKLYIPKVDEVVCELVTKLVL